MEAVSISSLAGGGPAPANPAPRAAETGKPALPQPGSFGTMIREILEPTAESGPVLTTPLQAQAGRFGRLATLRGVSPLPIPKLGKLLTENSLHTLPSPANAGLAVSLASVPQPPLAPTTCKGNAPTLGKGSERAGFGPSLIPEAPAVSERVVSQPVLDVNLPASLQTAEAAPRDPKSNFLVGVPGLATPVVAAAQWDTALPSHVRLEISSVDAPVIDIGGSPALIGRPALQTSHWPSILQQVKQLQDTQASTSPAVAITWKPAQQTAPMLETGSAVRLVTALAAAPSSHNPMFGPSLPKPTVNVASAPIASMKDQAHTSPSRGNSEANAGEKDNDEPASAGSASQTHGSVADKVNALSGTLFLVKDAPVPALGTVAAHAVPVSANTETKDNSSDTSNLPAAPPTLPAPANHPQDFGRMVNDVQLAQSATHSEMRIAMQTDRLGNVELHARVAGDEVGAAITVEKRDAHAALAAELPALQQALNEKHLRIDQLSLLQGSLHSTSGEAGTQQQPQERPRQTHTGAFQASARQSVAFAAGTVDHSLVFDSNGRLSVRA